MITLFDKKQIKIGRGNDCDIRITDISVSRCHGVLKFENNTFVIQDNNSKFGSLVLMQKPFTINSELRNNISMQIGRHVLSFQLRKTWKILTVCFGYSYNKNAKLSNFLIFLNKFKQLK
jgi:pSer/pThr/pTyr-binding forkhead associated (FHA) protein